MRPGDVLKPLGVFVLVIALIVGGAFLIPAVFGGDTGEAGDADEYSDQSPRQYQPDNAVPELADEAGELALDADADEKRILIDESHQNQYARSDLEPVVDVLVRNGHTVDFGAGAGGGTSGGSAGGGFGAVDAGFNSTLQDYDAVIVVQPTAEFTDSAVAGMRTYAEAGGRVLVLGEPTRTRAAGDGLVAQPTQVSTRAEQLAGEFGMRIGSDTLYNVDDERNDNNYRSIYAEATGDASLTDGTEQVNFDTAAPITTIEGSDAEPVLRAVEGTRTLSTRRTGDYAVAARNDNVTVVGDSSFVSPSELYDADNERLTSNLLSFLVTGDKPDDVPGADNGTETGFGDDGLGGDDTGSGGESDGGSITPLPP